MTLPSELLRAVGAQGGGRLVLVLGAGASKEAPTGLPLADECAVEAHRRLVADGVLVEGACEAPEDLSAVADSVHSATGGQGEMVSRLPLGRLRNCEANEGALIAAAMLRERAVSSVLTLNFDLSMTRALQDVGVEEDVSVVPGPEAHDRLGVANLIYLHRNVDADPEEWILRSEALDADWQGQWADVMAQRVMSAPVTVFAGLGSPAAVLIDTSRRIRAAIPNGVSVFQVDPGPPGDSAFFTALGLGEDAYIQVGWCSFMKELAGRLVEEHKTELRGACVALISTEGWDDADPTALCERVAELGLVGLGRLRARWCMKDGPYLPNDAPAAALVADLLLGVGLIERLGDVDAVFEEDGVVEFRRGDQVRASIVVASGGGTSRWLALEARIGAQEFRRRTRDPRPRLALVGGVPDGRPATIAPPFDLVRETDSSDGADAIRDVAGGEEPLQLVSIDEIRDSPALVESLVA